jgi:hypothetical protein
MENNEIIIKSGNKEKSIHSYIIKICNLLESGNIILKAIGM